LAASAALGEAAMVSVACLSDENAASNVGGTCRSLGGKPSIDCKKNEEETKGMRTDCT